MEKEIEWLLRDKYSGMESEEFSRDVVRLKNGEPLGYVIGWVPFLNTKIFLDSHPLIPRTETEQWVERAIEELRKHREPHILDLCAGSGCIGVAVLKAIKDARVDFAEIDENHHTTILKNVNENELDSAQCEILVGDLFEEISGRYDAILSNPPYIDPIKKDRVEKSVSDYEPEGALYGGVGGLELIDRILSEAPKHLKKGGILYLEHEPEQSEHIRGRAKSLPYASCTILPDQFGILRYSRLQVV